MTGSAYEISRVGLILGGVLTDVLTWRWIFWISLIFSAIVIPSAIIVLPWSKPKTQTSTPIDRQGEGLSAQPETTKNIWTVIYERVVRFDVLGICLGIPGLLMLNYSLTSANTLGWGTGQIIGILVASVVLLALFLWHEHRATIPLMPSRLFRNRSFNLTLILAVNTYAVRQASTYYLTIQLQAMGYSPLKTSISFLPLGISALTANTLAGRLVPKLGARIMVSSSNWLTDGIFLS